MTDLRYVWGLAHRASSDDAIDLGLSVEGFDGKRTWIQWKQVKKGRQEEWRVVYGVIEAECKRRKKTEGL
jgi:hypothetical protein